jgi:predicted small metal-binding protein
MSKFLECAEVDPASGCEFVARGETVDDILQQVGEHAKEHGIHEVTPELIEQVKAHIHNA